MLQLVQQPGPSLQQFFDCVSATPERLAHMPVLWSQRTGPLSRLLLTSLIALALAGCAGSAIPPSATVPLTPTLAPLPTVLLTLDAPPELLGDYLCVGSEHDGYYLMASFTLSADGSFHEWVYGNAAASGTWLYEPGRKVFHLSGTTAKAARVSSYGGLEFSPVRAPDGAHTITCNIHKD